MNIHDMGARSKARNKHLLVIVDRASKFLFTYPLPNKTAEKRGTTIGEGGDTTISSPGRSPKQPLPDETT